MKKNSNNEKYGSVHFYLRITAFARSALHNRSIYWSRGRTKQIVAVRFSNNKGPFENFNAGKAKGSTRNEIIFIHPHTRKVLLIHAQE